MQAQPLLQIFVKVISEFSIFIVFKNRLSWNLNGIISKALHIMQRCWLFLKTTEDSN